MTKTSIRSALAAVAAIVMLPAVASAQTPDAPARKPAAVERQAEPRSGAPDRAGRDRSERRDVADRRSDRARGGERDHHRGQGGQRPDRRG